MNLAKSLFMSRDYDGYVGKEDHEQNFSSALDDDGVTGRHINNLSINEEESSDGPFSALTPSMVPQELLSKGDSDENLDHHFDAFGFYLVSETKSNLSTLALNDDEDPKYILEWDFFTKEILQSNQNKKQILGNKKKYTLVKKGIPHRLRPYMWEFLSGARKKRSHSDLTYDEIVRASNDDGLVVNKQIEKDLAEILPNNACFSYITSTGVPRLRRVLRSLAWLFPDIGYCQGIGIVAATLLLTVEEELTFWIMMAIVEDLLPASFYASNLIGILADQKVLRTLIASYLPAVDQVLNAHDIEISLITTNWFLTLYANVFEMKTLLCVWDLLFLDGSVILFKIIIAMLKIKQQTICGVSNSAEIFNTLSDIPREITFELLVKAIDDLNFDTLTNELVDTHRKRHLAYLMVDNGALVGDPNIVGNLPKQHLQRRQINKKKSLIETLLFGESSNQDETSAKNIKHTEILVDLREAILQVSRHFIVMEPKLSSEVSLTADYNMQSHAADKERFIHISRSKRKRARALVDFERQVGDELGFRKNDIVEVISDKDEHCWIGELNGLRGWFPSRFVQLLEEKSVKYSKAGDDSVTEKIAHLARGVLAPSIIRVLLHGMKKPSFLDCPCHPWLFIEEASAQQVEKDFDSVYSRLVLCKTYRLDEAGKVLTQEELLYRCVQAINLSHDNAHAQMDVKLRTLVCAGLNEKVLHLWLEVLCSSNAIVQKWYEPWSFINSPGWVQIKCELRILSQFSFNLNLNWELPKKKEGNTEPLEECVREMLVKHHLFSWNL